MLEHILPSPGRSPSITDARSAVVVGAGLAGLANAIILAEKGVKVTLIEKEDYLGGRLGAWADSLGEGQDFEMERGFHAFFRQYYNLRSLLRRIDPELSMLQPMLDYPILGPRGQQESFTGLPARAPWNMIAMTWRSPTLKLRDLPNIDRERSLEMLRFDPDVTYERWDQVSAKTFLDDLNFPPNARQMLFEVFAHSFFNPEDNMSAAELLMMFHFYFIGNPEGLIFDVADRPFAQAILHPLADYLKSKGGTILRSAPASRVVPRAEGGFEVFTPGQTLVGDWLTLALGVEPLQRLLKASPKLGEPKFREKVQSLALTSPFAVWRLWLDGPVNADRAPFAGTVGLGLLDNISIYEQLEDESRAWAQTHGGSVVELHAYGVPDNLDEEAVKADLLAGLHKAYPETQALNARYERWLYRQDCPSFAPGSHHLRPGVDSGTPGLTLAGDFCRLPFPSALMERAVMSGILAANHQLATQSVEPEPLYSIRPRGWLARRKDS